MATQSNPLRLILGELPSFPLLTHAQEISLSRKVSSGNSARKILARRRPMPHRRRHLLRQRVMAGKSAREALVLHNLPLVLSIAGRFRNSTLDYEDLIQEGILGLIKAAERYDPRRGTRFGTLAVWWIRQSIGRAVANTGRTIRLPVNRGWRVSQLRRVAAQLAQQNGQEPIPAEIARLAGMSVENVTAMMRDGQPVISLDIPPVSPDERDILERMADDAASDPEQTVVQNNLGQILEEALGQLDAREAQILRMRFGLDGGEARPLRVIATDWKMSPEGVRQISERAMEHLRAMPHVQELSAYLEGQ